MLVVDEDKDKWIQITNSVFNPDKSIIISSNPSHSSSSSSFLEKNVEDFLCPPPPPPITNESSSDCHCHSHSGCYYDEKNLTHQNQLQNFLIHRNTSLDKTSSSSSRRNKDIVTSKSFTKKNSTLSVIKQKQHLLYLKEKKDEKKEQWNQQQQQHQEKKSINCEKQYHEPNIMNHVIKKSTQNQTQQHQNHMSTTTTTTTPTISNSKLDDVDDENEDTSSKMTRQMDEMKSQLKKLTFLLSQKTLLINKQKIIIEKQKKKLEAYIITEEKESDINNGDDKVNQKEILNSKSLENCKEEKGSDESKMMKKIVGLDSLTYRVETLEKKMQNFLKDLPKRIETQFIRLLTKKTHHDEGDDDVITSGFQTKSMSSLTSKSKWKPPLTSPVIKPRSNLSSKYRSIRHQQQQDENSEKGYGGFTSRNIVENDENEKRKFEEKVIELEKIVANLKQFFLLQVLRGETPLA